MKRNMGVTDRVIRFTIAITIGILYWQGIIASTFAYILLALATIFVVTGFIRYCPLYSVLGLNTCKER